MMNLWEANIVYELLVRSLSTLLRRDVMWDGGGVVIYLLLWRCSGFILIF